MGPSVAQRNLLQRTGRVIQFDVMVRRRKAPSRGRVSGVRQALEQRRRTTLIVVHLLSIGQEDLQRTIGTLRVGKDFSR